MARLSLIFPIHQQIAFPYSINKKVPLLGNSSNSGSCTYSVIFTTNISFLGEHLTNFNLSNFHCVKYAGATLGENQKPKSLNNVIHMTCFIDILF